MGDCDPKNNSSSVSLFSNEFAEVKPSLIHGLGNLFSVPSLEFIFFSKGVFAKLDLRKGQFVCSVPGYFFPKPKLMDHFREYVWEIRDFKKHMDSTCFRGSVVLPDGFGQYINTSHPKTCFENPNAQYVCGNNFNMDVFTIKEVLQGEEILCDYHWQLATIHSADGLDAAGRNCGCHECDMGESNLVKFERVMSGVASERFSIWKSSSSHVFQTILHEYFQQVADYSGRVRAVTESTSSDEKALLLLSEKDLTIGAGIPELCWRGVLDSLTEHPMQGGRLVQVSSTLGMEALLAAMYKPELECSISVLVSSTFREVYPDDVTVALSTFRRCLDATSPTYKGAYIKRKPAPAAVITPYRGCWASIGMTHLVIGEGADGSSEALDLTLAKKIVEEADSTLLYVFTTSQDLHTYLLSDTRGCWRVSGYRKRAVPVISSLTGDPVFFSELVKDSKPSSKVDIKDSTNQGLPNICARLKMSGMSASADLLNILEIQQRSSLSALSTFPVPSRQTTSSAPSTPTPCSTPPPIELIKVEDGGRIRSFRKEEER
jgi:hypothetical protein